MKKYWKPPPIVNLLETNIAPENQWLEDVISFWEGLFPGAMLVSGRVRIFHPKLHHKLPRYQCPATKAQPFTRFAVAPGLVNVGAHKPTFGDQ